MSPDSPIMVRENLTISITQAALNAKQEVLDTAAMVVTVGTQKQQEWAVNAQIGLRRLTKAVESARRDISAPILEATKSINAAAKGFCESLEAEDRRIGGLISAFQDAERRKREEEERKARAEADRLRREQEEKNRAALAAANPAAPQPVEAPAPVVVPKPAAAPRVEGQVIRTDWEITITSLTDLARAHPDLVTITPKMADIRRLVSAGTPVTGVSARKTTTATVRV